MAQNVQELQGKFDREVCKYWDCFKAFKKNFGDSPDRALLQATQFEYHLKEDMWSQGLKLGPRLATGGYGSCYKAAGTKSVRGPLCVKIPLNLERKCSHRVQGSLKEEIEHLRLIHGMKNRHLFKEELASIIKPIMPEIKLFQGEPVLITKRYPFTLHELIQSKEIIVSDMQWRHFFKSLFKAVNLLHHLDVCHRDLKPNNIMVEEIDGPDDKRYRPVIIDFGFVNKPFGPAGTPGYMAPEAFLACDTPNCREKLEMLDVFALGVILFEVKMKRRPRLAHKCPQEFKQDVEMMEAS